MMHPIRTVTCLTLFISSLCCGTVTAQQHVTVINETVQTLHYFFIASAGTERWSDDLFKTSGVNVILTGRARVVVIPYPGCVFDVKVTDAKNNLYHFGKQDFCQNDQLRISDGSMQEVVLDPRGAPTDPESLQRLFAQNLNTLIMGVYYNFNGLVGQPSNDLLMGMSSLITLPGSVEDRFQWDTSLLEETGERMYVYIAQFGTLTESSKAHDLYEDLIERVDRSTLECGKMTFEETSETVFLTHVRKSTFLPIVRDPLCDAARVEVQLRSSGGTFDINLMVRKR